MKTLSKLTTAALLFALILGTGIQAFAAELPSGLQINQLEQTIDDYVERYRDTTAAVSIALFTDDDVLFEKPYGYIDIENSVSNNEDTVMDYASVTKLFVWVSVMQFMEDGKLDLHEDIRTYLPDGFLRKLRYDDPITMLHLMNHNAGWQNIIVGMGVPEGSEIKDLGDALRAYEPVQVFRPGEHTAYSNYGSALAGYIVERISGQPFYEYVHENIFTPLEMNHVAIKPDLSDNLWVKERRANLVNYTTNMQNLGVNIAPMPLYPCGQATGTLADLRKFAQALLPDENGGTVLFKNPETLALMYTPTSYYPDGETPRYCHGFWAVTGYDGNVIGHAGNTNCSTMLIIDPDAGVGAVVMTNQQTEGIYNYDLLRELFGKEEFSGGGNAVSEDITGIYRPSVNIFRGLYKFTGLFLTVPVSMDSDGVLYNPIGGEAFEFIEPGVYRLAMGDMSMIAYADISQSGQVGKISITPHDYIPVSGALVIFEIALLVLFIISALYGLVTLFVMLIRKLRKKEQMMSGWRAAVCGAALLAPVCVLSLLMVITPVFAVYGILFMVLAFVPIIYAVLVVLKIKKLETSGKQKFQIISTAVIGLIVTLNIVYWELWMFWV